MHTLACPYHLEEMRFIEGRKKFSHRKKKKQLCKKNVNKIVTLQLDGLALRNPTLDYKWCSAGECLINCSVGGGTLQCVAFADSHGVNIPTMANSKPPA